MKPKSILTESEGENDPLENNLSVLVIGAGGIGGITAAAMKNAGYNVEVVDNWPGLAAKVMDTGLHVFGETLELRQKMKAWGSIGQVYGKRDVIMVATKANILCEITQEIIPLLKDDSVVVSLQNGICEEYLAREIGSERVLGCVVGWGATVHEPGELEKTSSGDFVIGSIDGHKVNHFDYVTRALSTIAPVVVSDNVLGSLYSKLIINSCITTLGAICGLKLGEMLGIRKMRNIFIQIIREAVMVGKAAGIKIEKYAGKLDFYDFAESRGFLPNLKKHLMIRIIGFKYRRLKSSSLQSLETGRKTEIMQLNGYIISKGAECSIDTPLNNFLVQLVTEIENGKRKISPKNFELPFFVQYN